jgi:dimethylargininase
MLTAITRGVSPCMKECHLTFISRHPIDVGKAARQLEDYRRLLSDLGVRVISLPPEPELPDAVFVEDTAVITDEVAVITAMGAAARRHEVQTISKLLSEYRPLAHINGSGTLEGGDVVRAGRTVFVGLSTRTNAEGAEQLRRILEPHGYAVKPVEVHGCLHLSTGCAHLGRNTILVNREWVDVSPFEGFDLIDVLPSEPWGANALRVGDHVIIAASCPLTAERVRARGFRVHAVDISELEKAEGGLTCMSLILNS